MTAPDRVPIAMIRSSGSKASALGWLGKPCSTVCREAGVSTRHNSHPRPTQGSLQLCPCCTPSPLTSTSSAARWMITPPAGEEGPEPWPHQRPSQSRPVPLDTWVHDNKQNGAHKGGCMGTDANPSCPMGWAPHPTHPGRLKQGAVRGTPHTQVPHGGQRPTPKVG